MNNTGLTNTELADAIFATQEMIESIHDADLRNHVFRKHLSALLAEQLARAVARVCVSGTAYLTVLDLDQIQNEFEEAGHDQ